jgi:hypothetical protein
LEIWQLVENKYSVIPNEARNLSIIEKSRKERLIAKGAMEKGTSLRGLRSE